MESLFPKSLTTGEGESATRTLPTERTPAPLLADVEPTDELNWAIRGYIALVALAAVGCALVLSPSLSFAEWEGLATLGLFAILFERVGLKIYGETHISVGVVALFAVAVVYGAAEVALTAPLVVFAATVFTRSRWPQRIFDMSSYALANVAAALVFHALISADDGVTFWWVPAGILAAAVNYGVNIPLVGFAVSLSTGERWLAVWRQEHQWLFPYYIVFGLLGLALAAAYVALGVVGILAFVAPPLMMRFTLHQYVTKTEQTVLELKQKNVQLKTANREIIQMTRELKETYDGTLEALVLALDARDRETRGHSIRVSMYVVAIARRLGVARDAQEWEDMRRGALLHDVGKIGVSDYILHKPGPLTPEEWGDMKRHPHIGHEMLKDIAFLSGAAAIVEAHHERFDGKGYPRGLAGDEIPLGARMFAAADTFDAMTSDRPYRKALPAEVAREEIIRHSGTQFDPQVVQAFLMVYEEILEIAGKERYEEQAQAA